MFDFQVLTRGAGLARLAAFAPAAGGRYAASRNTDRGAGREPNTSALSPYLRRRLLTEPEVISAAIEAHGRRGAERFVEEVVWRSYFKGHLETRPSIWIDFKRQAAAERETRSRMATLAWRLPKAARHTIRVPFPVSVRLAAVQDGSRFRSNALVSSRFSHRGVTRVELRHQQLQRSGFS